MLLALAQNNVLNPVTALAIKDTIGYICIAIITCVFIYSVFKK